MGPNKPFPSGSVPPKITQCYCGSPITESGRCARTGESWTLCESHIPIESTLKERGRTHGDFKHNSHISQELKRDFRRGYNWDFLSECAQEALDMIANKISRILAGDPNFADHWQDIAGYATLVEKRLNETQTPPTNPSR